MPPSLSPHSHSETPSLLVQSHRQSNSRRHPKLCSVTGPKLSTLSTPFLPRRRGSRTIAKSSAPLIFLAHGHKRDTASLHLVLHFFFLGSVRLLLFFGFNSPYSPQREFVFVRNRGVNSWIRGQLCLQEQRRDMNRELEWRNEHRIERIGIKNGFLIQVPFFPDL